MSGWGERSGVLIGDYIYSRAFRLSTEVPGMARVLSDTTHTIREGETGVFFDWPEPQLIRRAVKRLTEGAFSEVVLRAHAAAYSEERFIERLRALVAQDAKE